ncbi:MAG: Ldh family oxidoreductase [Planctomycetota bacterium]|nr:Ldh family oxidoreductase [Planctomycetota bacterium]MDA1212474.1 Ldh family oxidoreductase [Planctomycetota bacterium]
MPILTAQTLERFAHDLLLAGGTDATEATVVSASLVQSNLRGHDSHGVMRIPFYLMRLKEGALKSGARLTVVRETPAAVVGDGHWGFGQVLAQDLLNRILDKAETVGIACGTLRQSAHIGRLGEYAETAAARGLTSIICANTHGAAQRVAPVGGKRPRLGTNPLCIGVPGGKEGPCILDFGTSATAEGKVRVKQIAGQQVPPGWLLDPEGKPTTDPNQLYGNPPGSILPMGGDQAYKGFGLAYMIELLCGGFSGGPVVHENPPPPMGNCAVFIVMDPKLFAGSDHLVTQTLQLEGFVRGTPLIDGVKSITLPGDPERRTLADREKSGIPLDDGNWGALTKLAGELNVALP